MDFTELVDQHALAAMEAQLAFADLLGDGGYDVDMQAGRARVGGLDVQVGLLGTAASASGTWLWGWANPAEYPAPLVATAARVRAFGEEHAVPELVAPEVALDDRFNPMRAGIAAVAATGLAAFLPLDAGGGTTAVLSVESAVTPPPPAVEPTRLAPVLQEAIGGGIVVDWPRALAAYATHRGGGPVAQADGMLVLPPAGGDRGAAFELDALGRVTRLQMTRSATPHDPS